ncbi:MAG: type II toxin-antitoxin system HicA family toxin [candidate division KSB1 bacterium]
MSDRLPRLTASEVIKALEKDGFYLARSSGGHRIYKNGAGKRVTVSYHAGKILHPKVLKSILHDAGWTVDKLDELLR